MVEIPEKLYVKVIKAINAHLESTLERRKKKEKQLKTLEISHYTELQKMYRNIFNIRALHPKTKLKEQLKKN